MSFEGKSCGEPSRSRSGRQRRPPTRELGLQPPYARRGIDYYVQHKVYAVHGDVTLPGLKVNIEVQAQDGVLKEPLPRPEKYTDLTYLRQAQKELGL